MATSEHNLGVFTHQLAEQLKRAGKHRLSETYTSAVNTISGWTRWTRT